MLMGRSDLFVLFFIYRYYSQNCGFVNRESEGRGRLLGERSTRDCWTLAGHEGQVEGLAGRRGQGDAALLHHNIGSVPILGLQDRPGSPAKEELGRD